MFCTWNKFQNCNVWVNKNEKNDIIFSFLINNACCLTWFEYILGKFINKGVWNKFIPEPKKKRFGNILYQCALQIYNKCKFFQNSFSCVQNECGCNLIASPALLHGMWYFRLQEKNLRILLCFKVFIHSKWIQSFEWLSLECHLHITNGCTLVIANQT